MHFLVFTLLIVASSPIDNSDNVEEWSAVDPADAQVDDQLDEFVDEPIDSLDQEHFVEGDQQYDKVWSKESPEEEQLPEE
jgi:hypothetical protein